jgi:hypothetical protein
LASAPAIVPPRPRSVIEIFELGTPRPAERGFDAAADGPNGLGFVGAADAADRGIDVVEGAAAGDIGHEVAGGIAEAAAYGAEPVILDLATQTAVGGLAFGTSKLNTWT